jgi:hypothetical protein
MGMCPSKSLSDDPDIMEEGTMKKNVVWVLVAVAFSGCASSAPRAVPVYCENGEKIGLLVGTWSGEYVNTATFRVGGIEFSLEPEKDTAYGMVIMYQRRTYVKSLTKDYPFVQAIESVPAQTLGIKFVYVSGDSVRGTLDPYYDPECDCLVSTTFHGAFLDDCIEGTFTSLNTKIGLVSGGNWAVHREHQQAR